MPTIATTSFFPSSQRNNPAQNRASNRTKPCVWAQQALTQQMRITRRTQSQKWAIVCADPSKATRSSRKRPRKEGLPSRQWILWATVMGDLLPARRAMSMITLIRCSRHRCCRITDRTSRDSRISRIRLSRSRGLSRRLTRRSRRLCCPDGIQGRGVIWICIRSWRRGCL